VHCHPSQSPWSGHSHSEPKGKNSALVKEGWPLINMIILSHLQPIYSGILNATRGHCEAILDVIILILSCQSSAEKSLSINITSALTQKVRNSKCSEFTYAWFCAGEGQFDARWILHLLHWSKSAELFSLSSCQTQSVRLLFPPSAAKTKTFQRKIHPLIYISHSVTSFSLVKMTWVNCIFIPDLLLTVEKNLGESLKARYSPPVCP
jgi:hypothetical protein